MSTDHQTQESIDAQLPLTSKTGTETTSVPGVINPSSNLQDVHVLENLNGQNQFKGRTLKSGAYTESENKGEEYRKELTPAQATNRLNSANTWIEQRNNRQITTNVSDPNGSSKKNQELKKDIEDGEVVEIQDTLGNLTSEKTKPNTLESSPHMKVEKHEDIQTKDSVHTINTKSAIRNTATESTEDVSWNLPLYILLTLLTVLGSWVFYMILKFVYRFFSQMGTRAKARDDYRAARGTHHRRSLEQSLPNLQSEIKELNCKVQEIDNGIESVGQRLDIELRTRLLPLLIREKLPTLQGISEQFADKIIKSVFRGKLDDLRNAHHYVRGIGDSKQSEIDRWVRRTKSEMPKLLRQDFEGRKAIDEHYNNQKRQLLEELKEVQGRLDSLEQLENVGIKALKSLTRVSPRSFVKHLMGTPSGQDLSKYMQGLFAPWERPPGWFKVLQERYSG